MPRDGRPTPSAERQHRIRSPPDDGPIREKKYHVIIQDICPCGALPSRTPLCLPCAEASHEQDVDPVPPCCSPPAGGGYWAAKQTTDGASAEKTPSTGSTPWIRATSDGPAKDNMGMDFFPSMRSKKAARRAPSPSAPRSSRTWGAARQGEKIPIHQQIETVGYVGYDEDKLEAVNARMAG